METLGNPEPNRTNVEAMKSVVKDSGVLLMEEGEEKDSLADRVLEEALDIRGVDDINGLLAATDNRNINQRAVQTKIDDFGVAVAECIQELGDEGRELKEALIAGSFSLREKLPEAWSIDSTDQSGNDVSLSTLIYDASVTTSSRATKLAIIQETEWIDYRVTHRDTGVTLNEEVNNAIRELDALGKKSFNNREREIIRKKLDYLKGLKTSTRTENRSDGTEMESTSTTGDGTERPLYPGNRRPVINPETGAFEGYESGFQISKTKLADAFKLMETSSTMRWSDYLTSEWYKNLEATNPDEAYRISLMVAMSDAAAGLKYAAKDLEKILGSKTAFIFKSRHMSMLFNEDFKLVTSKMLADLCEFYVDSNGKRALRYREKNGKIIDSVYDKLAKIEDTEDGWARWLAEQRGRKEPNDMDRMNAYTAWNLFYAMGDSSMADRARCLPTWEGVISDALRTLNPEHKALGKWQVLKAGKEKTDRDIIGAEYFSALADDLLEKMKLERDLGHEGIDKDGKKIWIPKPIDGKKTLRQKILDGDISFFDNRFFYGFFDFVNGGRDLYEGTDAKSATRNTAFYDKEKRPDGDKLSLSELTMSYVFETDDRGNVIYDPTTGEPRMRDVSQRREFSFGDNQVTFMNEFRDSLEGAIMAYQCFTGSADLKDPIKFITTLKSKLGMVSDMRFNNVPAFTYARDPQFWRDILVCLFGTDRRRLSTDYMYLPRFKTKFAEKQGIDVESQPYNINLYEAIVNEFGLRDSDIDIGELFRLLGVKINKGEDPSKGSVTRRNVDSEQIERFKSSLLQGKRANKMTYGQIRDIDGDNDLLKDLVSSVARIGDVSPEVVELKRVFNRLVTARSYKNAQNVYEEIQKLL